MRSTEHDDIVKEFEAAPELKTPEELQAFYQCSDEGIRELAKIIAALCKVQEEWSELYVADWTLYPKDEGYDVRYCPEAEALNKLLKEYDGNMSVDAPAPRWLFLERYSRPAVGDETIRGTEAYNAYYREVDYVTAKMNLELDSATATRFKQFAEFGRYGEIEEEADLGSMSVEEFVAYLHKKYDVQDDDSNDDSDEEAEIVDSMSDKEFEAYLRKKYGVQDDVDSDGEEDDEDEDNEDDEEDYSEDHRDSIIVYDTRFRVKSSVFAAAFLRVAKCVSKDSKKPEERCVRVSADVTGIVISATDGGFTVRERIDDPRDFRVLFYGSFLADPRDFMKIFSEARIGDDERMVFALHFHFLTIKAARFRYRLFVEDGKTPEVHIFSRFADRDPGDRLPGNITEFPDLSGESRYFEMESGALKRMIRGAFLAVAPKRFEMEFHRFVFGVDRRKASLYSTDGRVFTRREVKIRRLSREFDKTPEYVQLNKENLRRIEGFLSDSGYVQIALTGERLRVQADDVFLDVPATNAGFRVLGREVVSSEGYPTRARFFAGDLANALRCVIGDGGWSETSPTPVTLEARNKRLVLSRGRVAAFPPLVEIPLKYCGNRTSVVLDAERLYEFANELPPETPVKLYVGSTVYPEARVQALFVTRDGLRYLSKEAR